MSSDPHPAGSPRPPATALRAAWMLPRWWPWLAPLLYALHLVEEALMGGGFVAWAQRHLSASFTDERFAWINALALPIVGVVAWVATRAGREWVVLLPFGALTLNGILHLASTLVTGTYSPGLVTGVLLYLPLGGFTLWTTRRAVRPLTWLAALAASVLAHALVAWIAFGR